MSINKTTFEQYIKGYQFEQLFNEMGWDKDKTSHTVMLEGNIYVLKSVAQKQSFRIFVCQPDSEGKIPRYAIRKKIATQVRKSFTEHLIIYTNQAKSEQLWQTLIKQKDKPLKATELHFQHQQHIERLYQRAAGVIFTLDEEDNITIIDVTQRIAQNFYLNAEKVTKQFYEKFKKEHTSFLEFISGISENVNKEWYASLMLNRLMFCYFIQKKGFLDGNKNYLREKLKELQANKSEETFYSFYRSFLLALFHQGLGAPERTTHLEKSLGRIPYLNGGLFDVHELEQQYPDIEIKDQAFERVFLFFDQYEWHLDTRAHASGKEINPDVIGYIFEKYINERAKMGAYYTKEDITEYISKNCILPYLLDQVQRVYPQAFTQNSPLWNLLYQNPDAYIYDALKKGMEETLPTEIAAGISSVAHRTEWNKPAPPQFALPTEIWREVVERRNRYTSLKQQISNGEVKSMNDFITLNLNLRQFVQDLIENTEDAKFLQHFYKALKEVTIIDPTCGSGAFLFAALNILEPLYEACLLRMRAFINEEDEYNRQNNNLFRNAFNEFRKELSHVQNEQHPNQAYYIYKSIILQNLYGVDIMREATEIAKLRLFLKLVATVEPDPKQKNYGLEPLPDIDFNIRAGNTLVGFATEAELNKGLTYRLDGLEVKPIIEEKCELVAKAFTHYKHIQLHESENYETFKPAKDALKQRLHELNHELNQLLHKQHSIVPFATWKNDYQPFHWFAEFYEILHDKGGFDVVIGNPPYVEYSKSKNGYSINNYQTITCGNLYAFVMEVASKILKPLGILGVIIPLASFSTKRMTALQNLYINNGTNLHIANFEATSNPSTLFIGVKVQLSIVLWSKSKQIIKKQAKIYTTSYLRTYALERNFLFERIFFSKGVVVNDYITRLNFLIEKEVLNKLFNNKGLSNYLGFKSVLYYRNMGNFFFKLAFPNEPLYYKNGKSETSSTVSCLFAKDDTDKNVIIALINSSLFYYYWIVFSDCYHLSKSDIGSFPFELDNLKNDLKEQIALLSSKYVNSIEKTAIWQVENKKDGTVKKYRRYFPQNGKYISDEIDKLLAQHYGFSE